MVGFEVALNAFGTGPGADATGSLFLGFFEIQERAIGVRDRAREWKCRELNLAVGSGSRDRAIGGAEVNADHCLVSKGLVSSGFFVISKNSFCRRGATVSALMAPSALASCADAMSTSA